MKIKHLNVEITPWGYRQDTAEVHIEVTCYDAETYHLVEYIPNSDFIRHFDWFMDKAKHLICKELESNA